MCTLIYVITLCNPIHKSNLEIFHRVEMIVKQAALAPFNTENFYTLHDGRITWCVQFISVSL